MEEAKQDLKRFKQWSKDTFSEWSDSILQHFLYAYNLQQNHDDRKYLFELHLDSIRRDDSVTIDERRSFEDTLEQTEEESEQKIKNLENDMFKE